jgi:hypothetical protein
MTSERVVRIVVTGTKAKVYSPFEAREAIKTLPRSWRSWDSEEKCWVIPVHAVAELTRALKLEGFTIMSRAGSGQRAESPRPQRSGESWADLMYASLGRELAGRAYKALVPVLHPDRGGATAAMQDLNAARDRAVS